MTTTTAVTTIETGFSSGGMVTGVGITDSLKDHLHWHLTTSKGRLRLAHEDFRYDWTSLGSST